MKQFSVCLLSLSVVCVLFLPKSVDSQSLKKLHSATLANRFFSPLGAPTATLININRISAWYSANGEQERRPSEGNSGLTFPRGTATAVYSAGLLWGGKFYDGFSPVLRVNGQSYNNGTKPGAILGIRTGIAEDPNAPDVHIWRIRKDYATADLRDDAAEINDVSVDAVTQAQMDSVRSQYAKDWQEWPWQKGAPFYDLNGNGVKDPDEYPGIAGANQVIWFVCNDIGVAQPWASPETGVEEQVTIWAYAGNGQLSDIVFKRFRLIYKGTISTSDTARIDSMYIAQWSDVDLGDYTDDLVGCDTMLNAGYVYNGRPIDPLYAIFNLAPPSIGYNLVQGPFVRTDNPADTAIFGFRKIPAAKNLPMTTFFAHASGTAILPDPPYNYNGAKMWYQILRGLPPRPVGPPDPTPWVDDKAHVTTADHT